MVQNPVSASETGFFFLGLPGVFEANFENAVQVAVQSGFLVSYYLSY